MKDGHIGRRQFVRYSAAGIAAVASAKALAEESIASAQSGKHLHNKETKEADVLVVGGGHTAIDCARSSVRLGGEVTLVYRRSRAEMPAIAAEVEAAMEEGVQFRFLAVPTQVLERDGRVVGLECIQTELGELDESGRPRGVPVPGSEFALDADVVIISVGQRPALDLLFDDEGLETTGWDTVVADPETLATGRPGVFAAGDCVTGPLNVLDAGGGPPGGSFYRPSPARPGGRGAALARAPWRCISRSPGAQEGGRRRRGGPPSTDAYAAPGGTA